MRPTKLFFSNEITLIIKPYSSQSNELSSDV